MSERITDLLTLALTEHGITTRRDDVWATVGETGVGFYGESALRSQTDGQFVVQVNIAVRAPVLGERFLWQSFAGIGGSEIEAEASAFMKFLLGPFHVLLSALANHKCDEGNEDWSTWKGKRGTWRVCESALVTQGVEDISAIPYKTIVERMKDTFLKSATPGVHWSHAFYAFMDGKRAALEVGLDGDEWAEGAAAFDKWAYKPGSGYVSGRHFFIAVPA